jgi:hypothetical protein
MKKFSIAIIMVASISAGAAFWLTRHHFMEAIEEKNIALLAAEREVTTVRENLMGYTKFIQHIEVGKKTLSEKMRFLAATVVQSDTYIQKINVQKLRVFNGDADVIVRYTTEYSFGFDVSPQNFDITSDDKGIQIKIGKPILVTSPSVTPTSHDIPNSSVFVDEKEIVIQTHQQLPKIAEKRGKAMLNEEPIRALCEKKLIEFFSAFLAKQGVKHIPPITITYR